MQLLHRLLVAVSVIALVVLFVLVVAQVVLRYGFGFTPYFTSEIASFALVWSVLAGAAASLARGEHIRVGLLAELLPVRANRLVERLFDTLTVVLFAVLAWAGVEGVAASIGQTSEGLQIPLAWPYLALPATFAACLLFSVMRLTGRGTPIDPPDAA